MIIELCEDKNVLEKVDMKNSKFNISYHPPGSLPLSDLTYVVIGAREKGRWIFVRHRERQSWELPAGHIEKDESAMKAAKRELFEETGTKRSEIVAINDYSVSTNGELMHGRIFYASIVERGPLPDSEIAEIKIREKTPGPATYPEAHINFLQILENYIIEQGTK